jgi:TRAP-type C4-dicarboxylate transport system substrate-binding protein
MNRTTLHHPHPLALAAALAFSIGITVCAGNAHAQAKVTLRVADVYPIGHPVAESTAKSFMEQVKKATNGAVDFQYFPAEQLGKGKDLLTLTQTGVADIGLIVPSYISDKMPLSAVAELPGLYGSSCEGTMALLKLVRENGALAKSEFAPNGVRVLIAHAFAPFQLVSTKQFKSLAQVEGQKLRSLSAATDTTIRKLKGVPLRISAPEINESMSRGTIDGGLMGYPTVMSYDLARLVKTGTRGANFGGAIVTYAISETKFKSLPAEVQKALVDAGEAASRNGCDVADKAVGPLGDKLKAGGVHFLEISADEQKSLTGILESVAQEWADQLDQRGKPGGATLKEFRAALKDGAK